MTTIPLARNVIFLKTLMDRSDDRPLETPSEEHLIVDPHP